MMIADLLASCLEGHALPGAFYHDPGVYHADLDRIWRRSWLFAGHSCEAPEPGDYFRFDLDRDSLIVIRGDDGSFRALHNVCRHRGSLICTEPAGRVGRLVCPYHQWTYSRTGELLSCRGMHESIDRSTLGLHPAHVREVEGLVFICLADEPPDFERARALMAPMLRPQGLARARVAATADYVIEANWKIVWENNRECYHCNVNHPEYIRANFDHYNEDDASERVRQRMAAEVERANARWAAAGLAVTHAEPGMFRFPDAAAGIWYSANRTALTEGWVTESLDGSRVCTKLMGDYRDADVGTLRFRTLPNLWNHSSCDHAVTTRLLPAGPQRTLARVQWLVHPDAREGADYNLDAMMPFWQRTSEQDWNLCENQQRGVTSPRYTPGPYSLHKEYNLADFSRWYRQSLG